VKAFILGFVFAAQCGMGYRRHLFIQRGLPQPSGEIVTIRMSNKSYSSKNDMLTLSWYLRERLKGCWNAKTELLNSSSEYGRLCNRLFLWRNDS
jgi:hypothetical protein